MASLQPAAALRSAIASAPPAAALPSPRIAVAGRRAPLPSLVRHIASPWHRGLASLLCSTKKNQTFFSKPATNHRIWHQRDGSGPAQPTIRGCGGWTPSRCSVHHEVLQARGYRCSTLDRCQAPCVGGCEAPSCRPPRGTATGKRRRCRPPQAAATGRRRCDDDDVQPDHDDAPQGVETSVGDIGTGVVAVAGKVSPAELYQWLKRKTRKDVKICMPLVHRLTIVVSRKKPETRRLQLHRYHNTC